MASLVWIIAAAIAIFGVVSIMSGAAIAGIALLAVAVLLPSAGRALHV